MIQGRYLIYGGVALYGILMLLALKFGLSSPASPEAPRPAKAGRTEDGHSAAPATREAEGHAQTPAPDPHPRPTDYVSAPEDAKVAERIETVGPRDYFEAIERPQFASISEASAFMSDAEVVLGLELGEYARAYPINYLNDHEIVREEIHGLPLLVTW